MSASQDIASSDQHATRVPPNRLSATIGLVLLLCLPAALIVRVYHATNPRLLSPGDSVPALTIKDLASNRTDQFSFKGTLTALLFFSTDCPHCQREIASFDNLSKRFGKKIFFLAVSISGKAKTAEFINSNRVGVRILLDEEKTGQEQLGVDIVPALFLIGTDGTIAYSGSGEKTLAARAQQLSEFVSAVGMSQR